MITPEDQPQATFTRNSEVAPDVLRQPTAPAPSGYWKILAPLAGALVTAAVVIAAVLITSTQPSAEGAPTADADQDVTQLTGKDVGLALGLEPTSAFEVVDCKGIWAEFDDYEGFCLEGVTTDPLEEELLASQIVGWERTDALIAYVKAALELDAAVDAGADVHEQIRLAGIVREKKQLLHDEQRGQSTEPAQN